MPAKQGGRAGGGGFADTFVKIVGAIATLLTETDAFIQEARFGTHSVIFKLASVEQECRP